MPVEKPRINTASETVRVVEELMDYAMFTGNEQLPDLMHAEGTRQFRGNFHTKT